jgi:hypothetical protein
VTPMSHYLSHLLHVYVGYVLKSVCAKIMNRNTNTRSFSKNVGKKAFKSFKHSNVSQGSWSNTAKFANTRNIPFPAFYFTYSVGTFLLALICFVSLGDSKVFYCDSHSDSQSKKIVSVVSAAGAGFVFNIANVGITAAVQIVGLSIAFPIAVGVALVVGTVRSVGARSARIPIISLFSYRYSHISSIQRVRHLCCLRVSHSLCLLSLQLQLRAN